MKNILIVIPNDELGGAELLLKNLCEEYSKSNHVFCICLTKISKLNGWKDLDIKFIYLPTKNVYIGCFLLFFYLLGKKNDLTISSNVLLNGLLGFFRKIKIFKTNRLILRESTRIFSRYSGIKLFKYLIFYKLGYNYSDAIIMQTDLMKIEFIKNLPYINKPKIVVLSNPINLVNLRRLSEIEIDVFDFKFILAVGRLVQEKGFDLLINAFFNLKNINSCYKLIIIGDGPDRKKLFKMVNDLGLNNRVILLGYKKNPYPFMKHAVLNVVSSRIEGFPNVLLQMMLLNDNVVSTRCTDSISEIKGLNVCDHDSLAKTIENCIINN